MLSRLPRGRSWPAIVAVAVILLGLVPPAETYARRYVFAESLQFVVFATVVPALLALGGVKTRAGRGRRLRPDAPRGPGFARGIALLLAFMATLIAWRLPASVNALATVPGLAVLEMVSLAGAGSAVWVKLVESPPVLPRPLRAVFAAVAMWTIWILAYILGFSQVAWFTAYAHPAGLGQVADQEIATGILWAVPALCFIPVVYINIWTWLKDTEDPDEELRAITRAGRRRPGRWPRPPRGWDTGDTRSA